MVTQEEESKINKTIEGRRKQRGLGKGQRALSCAKGPRKNLHFLSTMNNAKRRNRSRVIVELTQNPSIPETSTKPFVLIQRIEKSFVTGTKKKKSFLPSSEALFLQFSSSFNFLFYYYKFMSEVYSLKRNEATKGVS